MNVGRCVLVLDGHTNQALACVRSLGRAGYSVAVASHQRRALGAWSRYCRAQYRLAGQSVAAFAALREWARARGVDTVLPLTERSCVLCNVERAEWEALGIVIACGPDAMLRGAFDKAETFRRADACGVSIPPTRYPTSLAECRSAAADLGLPCVIKSRFSNAWNGEAFLPDLGASYVSDSGVLEATVLRHKQGDCWPLVQAFVPGQGKGVFALCDQGRAVAWFAHERLRDIRPSGSGSSLRRAAVLDERLRAPAERLLLELQWHGPAMVEFRDDGEHPPRLIEVNGRFWGSLQLAIAAGVDFPRLWLAILAGERVEPSADYATDVTLRWLWGDVKRLLHIYHGPPRGYPGRYPTLGQGLRELFGAQPDGTRLEVWDRADPAPAIGEWVQGIGELIASGRRA